MIRFIPELIITSGREVIVQHAQAGEEACCVLLLFPHLSQVHVDAIKHDQGRLLITARSGTDHSICQRCGISAGRRHSRYRRRLHDLPVSGRPILIELEVRRFFCDNPTCVVRTFVEQIPDLTQRYARRTPLLRAALEAIALALAGRAGARLASVLGLAVGRSTLIRLIHALPDPEIGQLTAVGVDDFALRRGSSYGTVLIDMTTRRPIDLLPDRQADTLADWLRPHSDVEVICRDRASAYAEGAVKGAPQATQCADRWHLWHNLVQAVERSVTRHRPCLSDPPDDGPEQPERASAAQTTARQGSTRFAERTRAKHARIHELKAAGHSLRAIARQLRMGDRTVIRYAHAASPEELLWGQWTNKPSAVDDFKPYLHQRWQAGERNATRLLKEITALGYRGSYGALSTYLRPLRAARPVAPPAPSVRKVTGWLATHPDRLEDAHQLQLATVLDRCPELTALLKHVRTFAIMLTKRRGQDLPGWLAAVRADDLPALHAFAGGLERDLDAVTAGLTLPWSSGPVEGHVNRIKMLKRQMFGRAGFLLLRKRVLLTT
ncbi:ISL3 family transposase [Nonomuraea sp. NPDC049400]|uniref:ISL3 family transposase n=1 Tax=Nonomuraea sp. NPDC049400 TaxID=3364352 RepID=UPI00378890E2